MKSDQTIIGKNLMKQLNFITNLLVIKDKNIKIFDYFDAGTHKEVIDKLDDYPAPMCPRYLGLMAKYDFLSQKESPNRDHRQPENHSKINRESPYDGYRRQSICLYFDSHS